MTNNVYLFVPNLIGKKCTYRLSSKHTQNVFTLATPLKPWSKLKLESTCHSH